MTLLRTRRHARALCLRCLRVARRHHLTIVSLGVLAGALTLGLTSSSFNVQEPPTAQAIERGPPPPVDSLSAVPPTPAPVPDPARVIVFYLISSPTQQYEIEAALMSDSVGQSPLAAPLRTLTFRDFLLIRTADEEAATYDYLREIVDLAPIEGFRVRVVDLR